ncbi:PAS domain-containing methyl-accepting chemotaxis protein [Aquisalimonas lutea]|uniref:methyl-accepting chemotaxis protein n=1 Tax=Aquisalimonas lutea TaxID=1327750 RepID=UPI0025B5CAF1|nr:PAS domain-containing methyl-accepting chemotaxis protein [Aquisalimonas lutea]MDN3516161.1 PAS domain-containing methyl-accepting chemotaxis protein [Aquisalimonas lutea]
MRRNLPVTGREHVFDTEARLISTTTLKGVIQHVNDDFCRVAGFSRDELIGQAHNIIRHPDMPPAVFQDFWDTLKAGEPWMGIVKNRCKNGDHYWVSAYVAPIYEQDRMVGYQSVRTAPDRDDVRRAEKVYRELWRARRIRLPSPGLRGRTAAGIGAGVVAGLGAGSIGGGMGAAVAGLALVLAWPAALAVTARVRRASQAARATFDNPVGRRVYGGADDEAGQVHLSLAMQQARVRTLLGRVGDVTGQLHDTARASEDAAGRSGSAIAAQQDEMAQVATAMNEMSATIQEVSRNTSHAADRAGDAHGRAADCHRLVEETGSAMSRLADETHSAGEAIRSLIRRTEGIHGILDTIRGISEQTNLLALNAAIEAARAGDSGRGFSVVAEEVRKLSARTGEATTEIESVLGELRTGAEEAGTVMDRGQASSQRVQELTDRAADAVQGVLAAANDISDMNTQIASSAEEQSATAEEINRSVSQINEAFTETASTATGARETAESLTRMVAELDSLVRQFRA